MGSPKTFFLHLSLLVSSFTPRAGPERLPLSAYSRPRRVRTTVEAVYRNTKKIGSSVISMVPNWKKHLYFVTKVSFTKLNAAFSSRKRGV